MTIAKIFLYADTKLQSNILIPLSFSCSQHIIHGGFKLPNNPRWPHEERSVSLCLFKQQFMHIQMKCQKL